MKDIFANFYNKIMGFFHQHEEEENAKDVAYNRLKLVLMQDRTNLNPQLLERMRGEMIELLSKYVEMDKDLLELNFEQEGDSMALMLSIPVLRAKEEEEIEAALKAEDEAKKALKKQEETEESDSESEETAEESESDAEESEETVEEVETSEDEDVSEDSENKEETEQDSISDDEEAAEASDEEVEDESEEVSEISDIEKKTSKKNKK